MRNLLYLLTIIPSIVCASISADWKKMDSFGVEEAYQLITDPSSIMTVVKKNDFDDFNLQKFNLDTYVKALPETKNFIHQLVGITEWKVEKYEKQEFLQGANRVILVKLKGTYLRKGQVKVVFEEWHHFYESTFLQLQLIRNTSNSEIDHSEFFKELQGKWL